MTPLRVALVGCGRSKRATPAPARQLYTGCLFAAQLEEAERLFGEHVLVLSAWHGAVELHRTLEPYDFSMAELETWEREEWGHNVLHQVKGWLDAQGLPTDAVELHVYAGGPYVEPLRWQLPEWAGWAVVEPLAGLQVGQRLQRLAQERRAAA